MPCRRLHLSSRSRSCGTRSHLARSSLTPARSSGSGAVSRQDLDRPTTHEAVNEVLKDDRTFVRNARNAGKQQFLMRMGLRRGHAATSASWARTCSRTTTPTTAACANSSIRRSTATASRACAAHRRPLRRPLDPAGGRQCPVVDLMEGLRRPLPLAVICELLGLPEEDRPKFRRWVQGADVRHLPVGGLPLPAGPLPPGGVFQAPLRACRRPPRPGLMTALVQAEQDGDKLSENELLAMAFLLLLAGHETTVHLIGGGVLAR